jgi:hypothetical protein
MNILKTGMLPSAKVRRGTCASCRAEVEFTTGEAHQVNDRNETGYWVECPTPGCGLKIWDWSRG